MALTRVVIDTNVFVSAAIKTAGAEAAVLDLVASAQLALFVCPAILSEYQHVLNRPRLQLQQNRTEFLLELARSEATLVETGARVFASSDDADNRFLECAEAAQADYLVTGNKRHFPPRWKSTEIVNARELLARLKR